jgi:acetyl-CoA acyltransferase
LARKNRLSPIGTPFRPHGRVTAGNSAGLNDGATGCVIAAQDVAAELGLDARMRLVDFSFAGVDPEVMGIGPVPATETVLARNDLTIDDIGLIEINEAFAVQVLAFLDHFKIADDDPRVNQWGRAGTRPARSIGSRSPDGELRSCIPNS